MLPQHVHGLSQAGSGLGPEESTSSMASGMIGKYVEFKENLIFFDMDIYEPTQIWPIFSK